ncbi:DUF58 domain-containing protein [Methylomagnum sp.]
MTQREFHYRIPGHAGGARPGAHPSRQVGDGQRFRHLAPFLAHPDPRRLDLRASLTDPFETWRVRLCEQRSAIPVYALADVSGSMDFRGVHPKIAVLADFIEGLAESVYRAGDTLGLLAAAEDIRPEFCLSPSRLPGPAFRLAARLRPFRPHGLGCRGLVQAGRLLPGRRCLVFLLSDFHLPLNLLREILTGLCRHDVVPVVLWDEGEALPDARGLARLADLEGGGQRLLLLRPALRERLADNLRQRRERLVWLFRQFGWEPLFLSKGFDPDQVTRYFLGAA